jgi:hypothetical protein
MIFAPVPRLTPHGAHKPALRRKPANRCKPRPPAAQPCFGTQADAVVAVVFIDEIPIRSGQNGGIKIPGGQPRHRRWPDRPLCKAVGCVHLRGSIVFRGHAQRCHRGQGLAPKSRRGLEPETLNHVRPSAREPAFILMFPASQRESRLPGKANRSDGGEIKLRWGICRCWERAAAAPFPSTWWRRRNLPAPRCLPTQNAARVRLQTGSLARPNRAAFAPRPV